MSHAADAFKQPTKDELEMKSLPGYPGAAAVVLYREEITKDDLHVVMHYDRIKILTEEGKKYANVELGFVSTVSLSGDYRGDDKTLDDIAARTIHADGTVIPFTGKPYLKVISKGETREYGYKRQMKVFTLPDVEVGSIIEYRYSTRYNDYVYESAHWYIQDELYLKEAHFQWFPTTRDLVDSETGNPINSITWFPILPAGAKLEQTEIPGTTATGGNQKVFNLVVKDIPPRAHEEHMPPIASFSYRVLFNFSQYRSAADYWKSEGKKWSKRVNSIAEPNSELKPAVDQVVAGAGTQEEKLRKIYARLMELENTNYTREHEQQEDKAEGLGKVSNASDVLAHKRGTSTQLTELFVAMARAEGMKAYVMLVPDRSIELFTPGWMSFSQFDDIIAIVNVDGKEQYFDPGERYCPYGHLAWQHTLISGIRQVDSGTDFGQTPGEPYAANKTLRVANLTMDEHGEVTGKIDLTFFGAPALQWRHAALRGDEESLKLGLREDLERMVSKGLEVKVTGMGEINGYEKPLAVHYQVKGAIGTPSGKRLMVPADLLLADERATFPHEKRETAVYFQYPQLVQDALRIFLPKQMAVEAVPAAAKFEIPKTATYNMTTTADATSFTTRRNVVFGAVVVPVKDYAGLRDYYSQFETKDKESVVLKAAAPEAANVEMK